MRKFNIRKGLDCLNAGSSLAAPPPPLSAPPSNQEPEIAETLQARTSSSARKCMGQESNLGLPHGIFALTELERSNLGNSND
ncbi:syntaxin-binding protein 5-like isoform X7 [Tamandua tetradactyla]|uniref:syntaxin-binding protein 5-like isoform X7 n=1 Tax=Tamandua tetradactyla TaxID=48850 RepID=UPI0040546EA9